MSSLALLQREFLDALFEEGATDPAGIEIYRRNALANWHAALAATYPVVRRLVGDAFFREAARRFALAHPSRGGDLNEYGAGFAAFLEGYAPAAGLPYLADVARLEAACHESCHAADAGPLDFTALAAVPAHEHGRLAFRLHPAARLVRSAHPIAAIWEANQADRDGEPRRAEGPDWVLVHREGFDVRVARVDRCEWEFLAAVARGASLEDAAANLDEADAARVLTSSLALWVGEGVIASFALPAGEA